jgi:hypothetical protein
MLFFCKVPAEKTAKSFSFFFEAREKKSAFQMSKKKRRGNKESG